MYIGRVSPLPWWTKCPIQLKEWKVLLEQYGRRNFPDNDNNRRFQRPRLKIIPPLRWQEHEYWRQLTSGCKRSTVYKGHNKLANQYLQLPITIIWKRMINPNTRLKVRVWFTSILKKYNKEKDKLEQRLTQDYNQRDERLKADIESSIK